MRQNGVVAGKRNSNYTMNTVHGRRLVGGAAWQHLDMGL
jgi:hypothetical protein